MTIAFTCRDKKRLVEKINLIKWRIYKWLYCQCDFRGNNLKAKICG